MSEARTRAGDWVRYLGLRLVLIGCVQHQHGALSLFANDHHERGLAPLWIEKVKRALSLIESTAPWVYRRLLADVDRILVDEIQGPHYNRPGRVIWLRGPILHSKEVESVAMTLIHEATHARIATNRIGYSLQMRERHEIACCKAEARLANRLGRPDLAAAAVDKLKEPWWTEDALRARHLDEFDRLGLSGPVSRILRDRIKNRRPSTD